MEEKEIKKMVKKELSDLKFSDFMGSGHVYDHTKENPWEAIGATNDDCNMVRTKMLDTSKTVKSFSACIEENLKLDMPAPWKAMGFMKLGEGILKARLLGIVEHIPEGIPVPALKGLLTIVIMESGI